MDYFSSKQDKPGKAEACIKMIQFLSSGKRYKIWEIAEHLQTNPRNVIEYRETLEQCGYLIRQTTGKYGGYELEESHLFPSLRLTKEEQQALFTASTFLETQTDVVDLYQYRLAMGKIFSSIKNYQSADSDFIIPGVTLAMSNQELATRYHLLKECIRDKTKVKITFLSNDNIVRPFVVRPYKLFIHNNAWSVLGARDWDGQVRYYKLTRIRSIEKLNEKFRVPLTYNEKEYLDETGLKKVPDWSGSGGEEAEWVHIKLRLHGKPAMYVKEYLYGKNQQITEVDKNTTILECDMQYRYNTVKFVLGFGVDCKVLEPQWLKEKVLDTAKAMITKGGE